MKTLTSIGNALLARYVAGEPINIVKLIHIALPVAQRWAVGGTEVTWGGFTWAAREIGLTAVENELGPSDLVRITLPGITDSERSLAFEDAEGVDCNIYVALVDPDTAEADAVLVWAGQIGVAGWEAGRQAAVHYTAESMLAAAMAQRPSRYTDEEQQRLHPGDTCLNQDPALDAAPISWPARSFFIPQ